MWYSLTVVLIVVLDQLSKYVVVSNFVLYEVREIIPGFFNLVYVTNTGAAFSFLADIDSPWRHYFFLGISFIAILGLSWYYCIQKKELGTRTAGVVLGLLSGGAIGNLLDRLRYGAVTDFLDFYYASWHWPAFNVADSAIFVGAFMLILLNFSRSKGKLSS